MIQILNLWKTRMMMSDYKYLTAMFNRIGQKFSAEATLKDGFLPEPERRADSNIESRSFTIVSHSFDTHVLFIFNDKEELTTINAYPSDMY